MLFVDEFCGILVYIKFGADVTSQYEMLTGAGFEPLCGISAYGELCERVRALIEYRTPTGV